MELVFPEQPQPSEVDLDNQTLELIRHSLAYSPSRGPSLELEMPDSFIPVFSLSIPDARRSKPLSYAALTAWKRYVFQGNKALGEVDYLHLEPLQIGKPISFRQGALCEGLVAALNRAERRAEPATGQWEISLLLLEGLQVEALWLREKGGVGEWLVPIPPVNSSLQAHHFYKREDFEGIISKVAEARMRFKAV